MLFRAGLVRFFNSVVALWLKPLFCCHSSQIAALLKFWRSRLVGDGSSTRVRGCEELGMGHANVLFTLPLCFFWPVSKCLYLQLFLMGVAADVFGCQQRYLHQVEPFLFL